jgi:hypothetical protein
LLPPYDHFVGEIEAFCAGLNDEAARRAWREDALGQSQALEAIRLAAGRCRQS